jgi:tetraacyldisaccharide 4'-kinase
MKKSPGLKIQDYLNFPHSKLHYSIISTLAYPLSLIYKMLMIFRREFFEIGVFRGRSLNHPVISVGNITTGGTGKTPLEIYLVYLLKEMNLKPLLLSRGYGGKSKKPMAMTGYEVSAMDSAPDEVEMISKRFPDLPIGFGKDRITAYNLALRKYEFDIVILDDGFQHLQINRDLDIIILDAQRPYGSGRMLPSGNLREPKSVLKFADLLILNQKAHDRVRHAKMAEISSKYDLPLGIYEIIGIKALRSAESCKAESFKGMKCGLITAIGGSESFVELMEGVGLKPEEIFRFRDHYDFTEADLREVEKECHDSGIKCLFTTEKDAVKLERISFEKPDVYIIQIGFSLINGAEKLKQRIRALAPTKA